MRSRTITEIETAEDGVTTVRAQLREEPGGYVSLAGSQGMLVGRPRNACELVITGRHPELGALALRYRERGDVSVVEIRKLTRLADEVWARLQTLDPDGNDAHHDVDQTGWPE